MKNTEIRKEIASKLKQLRAAGIYTPMRDAVIRTIKSDNGQDSLVVELGYTNEIDLYTLKQTISRIEGMGYDTDNISLLVESFEYEGNDYYIYFNYESKQTDEEYLGTVNRHYDSSHLASQDYLLRKRILALTGHISPYAADKLVEMLKERK